MNSIQSLITEHVSILLQEYYRYHFRGFPIHELSLEVRAERVPELADVAAEVAKQLIPAFISSMHQMSKILNGSQMAEKEQKQFNLKLEEN